MLKPYHKSYYQYFEKTRRKGLAKYFNRRLRTYKAVRKLLGRECTVREFHYLFNKIMAFLGCELYTPEEETFELQLRYIVDLKELLPVEEQMHTFKFKNRIKAHIKKFDIQSSVARIRRAYAYIPNDLIGLNTEAL